MVVVQYPYFEDEERKRVALITNRIANQMKQIKTFCLRFQEMVVRLLGGVLQKIECSDIYRVNPKHITHLFFAMLVHMIPYVVDYIRFEVLNCASQILI